MKSSVIAILAFVIVFSSWAQKPQIVIPFRSKNKWGYSDTLGRIKIKPKYDTVSLFDYDMVYKDNHVFAEAKLNGRPLIIDERGTVAVPPKYDYVKLINGLAEPTFIISKNNKFGLFAKGKELVAPTCDYIVDYSWEGLFQICQNHKCGLIDLNGNILIPTIYDAVEHLSYYDVTKTKDQQPGYNWKGIWDKQPVYYKIKAANTGTLSQEIPKLERLGLETESISKDNIDKFIDSVTKEFGLDSVQIKYNNLAILYKGSAKGIILTDAPKKIYFFSKSYNINYLKYFSPNSRNSWNHNSAAYIIGSLNGKYGIINEMEEQILPFIYDHIEERDGFFLLKQNGKTGFFVWNTMYPVIQPSYDAYLWKQYIPVNNGWRFTLFKIIKNGRTEFVGENGVNYFKD